MIFWKRPSHPAVDDRDAKEGTHEGQDRIKGTDFVLQRINDENISPTDVITRSMTAHI